MTDPLAAAIARLRDLARTFGGGGMRVLAVDVDAAMAVCDACDQLAQEIAALQAHLTSSGPDPRVVALDAQCRQQAQEIARLRDLAAKRKAALEQFGRHGPACPQCWSDPWTGDEQECDCGLAAALAEE